MKLDIQDLVVEVTRKCNMNCAHCMRGDSQNKDLNMDKFTTFLKNVDRIGTLTFTGGEPTMNLYAINQILDKCKVYNVYVDNFYIVTNGKCITTDFQIALLKWYQYCLECGDGEYCGVAVSRDKYHDTVDPANIMKLKAFSFFSEDDKNTNWNKSYLVDIGHARSINVENKRKPSYYPPEVEKHEDIITIGDGSIAFTCDGEILLDCDYEYENADEIKFCDYDDAVEKFNKAATNPDFEFPI